MVQSVAQQGEEMCEGGWGVQLFLRSWRPAKPHACLVIVPGFKDHGSRYSVFAEAMVGHGFAVYACDVRPRSLGGERFWVQRFEDYVSDLESCLIRVRKHERARRSFCSATMPVA